MSIPGLGKIPEKPLASAVRTIRLQPFWEWRFEVPLDLDDSFLGAAQQAAVGADGTTTAPTSGIVVRLLSGTAERDGTELAKSPASYTFAAGSKGKLLSWTGAELEVRGVCEDEYVAEYDAPGGGGGGGGGGRGGGGSENSAAVSLMNLHFKLEALRARAAASAPQPPPSSSRNNNNNPRDGTPARSIGPRLAVVGPASTGRSTVVRTLAAYATRAGRQPLVVNADPAEGMLSLPGTLSAAAFASVADLEAPAANLGWGATASSGPSAVPVRLPIVYYYGRKAPEEDADLYRAVAGRLARGVSARLTEDDAVRASGLLVDMPAFVAGQSAQGAGAGRDAYELLAHVVEEFSVNIIVVLESEKMNRELTRRFADERSSLGEPITIVHLDKSKGVVERDEGYLRQMREAAIKEYFFGDVKRTLSPNTQQVEFDTLSIFRCPDKSSYAYDFDDGYAEALERVTDPSAAMNNWTLTVMHASETDPPETILYANVMGFVYIADIDVAKRKAKILTPLGGRLGNRPLVWGKWPEPYINLVG